MLVPNEEDLPNEEERRVESEVIRFRRHIQQDIHLALRDIRGVGRKDGLRGHHTCDG